MEIKHKAKIHPSPPPSSSSSVFKLLPAAILALASLLSLDDREVLAYMIARSIQSSALITSTRVSRKKSTKKPSINAGNSNVTTTTTTTTTTYHKTPLFSCDCFYCYTAYWCRWDSSPNRELIHQAIEAFEDHLTNGEKPKKNNGRGKRRDRIGRQGSISTDNNKTLPVIHCPTSVADECVDVALSPVVEDEGSMVKEVEENGPVVEDVGGGEHQKGLATKVLPDVLGFFNSRLWSLWSPNL
ncbi:hypothetical protein IC582_017278 [Cucumis melo]|uniref:Uncharacterized protein n=1 Tax=Cucumis melo var. makuwa TaxID=1194695 RepID=A0A5A7TRT9_CUCMM|nr:uncharacterized protein E6C27_scaffold46G003170 [Cucumis melo var. makuwa]TYK17017.1 uncharacterized protein E5676_scaffold130G001620 [Cucumis melo var. makuwa]